MIELGVFSKSNLVRMRECFRTEKQNESSIFELKMN